MRKLKIIEHISLDGVIQHSADDGDFPYSDWTAPYRTPAGRDMVMAVLSFYLYGDQAAGTIASETPLWQAWIQERFPMPAELSRSE